MRVAPDQTLSPEEIEAFALGLYAVAHRDGLHEREAVLISSFWAESGGGPGALAELSRRPPIDAAQLATAFHDEDTRRLFLRTAVLLAWADGNASEGEMALIGEFAAAFGIAPADVTAIAGEVKEYLLSHLTHLQNSASAADVAKKMGL